jgi:hypothetical protein
LFEAPSYDIQLMERVSLSKLPIAVKEAASILTLGNFAWKLKVIAL